ncbi:MAG: GDSL-type esterase/lipase family protein [Planctomycetota bacterium]
MSDATSLSRRQLLGAPLLSAGALSLAGCAATAAAHPRAAGLVDKGMTVLFQGDSITDAGRDRGTAATPNAQAALGGGYAWFAAAGLLVGRAGDDLRVWNRGISGNKVFQLAARWQQDCLDLKPDVLSILIGVNDIWHTKNGDATARSRSTNATTTRCCSARARRCRVRLVVCEPFVLRCGAVDDSWFPEFDTYRAAARRVADRRGAAFVPFQTWFDRAVAYAPPEHWAKDGVHPSAAGAALMAEAWLEVVAGR